jgi:hypothetical protein
MKPSDDDGGDGERVGGDRGSEEGGAALRGLGLSTNDGGLEHGTLSFHPVRPRYDR